MKSSKFPDAHNILLCWQIILEICTERNNANFKSKWAAEINFVFSWRILMKCSSYIYYNIERYGGWEAIDRFVNEGC